LPHTIFIACDHVLVRHALGSLLRRQPGVEVAAEESVTADLPAAARRIGVDVVVIVVDGAQVAVSQPYAAIYRQLGTIPTLLLNLADDDESLLDALALGVRGIIDKNADGARLVKCIREVLNGEITISKRLASRLVVEYVTSYGERARRQSANGKRGAELSDRELEVLSRLARGESNKAIADHMFISVHTVRAHVRSLMQKLHVQNRVQAATYALKHGLIQAPAHDGAPRTDAAGASAGGRR